MTLLGCVLDSLLADGETSVWLPETICISRRLHGLEIDVCDVLRVMHPIESASSDDHLALVTEVIRHEPPHMIASLGEGAYRRLDMLYGREWQGAAVYEIRIKSVVFDPGAAARIGYSDHVEVTP
jgi:hypothetical protein